MTYRWVVVSPEGPHHRLFETRREAESWAARTRKEAWAPKPVCVFSVEIPEVTVPMPTRTRVPYRYLLGRSVRIEVAK